jgi:hypothetical protein
VAAAAVVIVALGVGIQVIRRGHVATPLAALLFVPAAILLAGIGLSGGTVPRAGRDGAGSVGSSGDQTVHVVQEYPYGE